MRTCVRLAPPNAIAVLIAAHLLAIVIHGSEASAFQDEEGARPEADEPAVTIPGGAEAPSLEIPPPGPPRKLDRGMFRPELREGLEGAAPADESAQGPPPFDFPVPSAEDRPKVLGALYEQLGEAKDAESAAPVMAIIERLWRTTGSATVDLLLSRAVRFTEEKDLELAREILDAIVAIAPDQAEAWYLRAKVRYLQREYDLALDDLRRALNLDEKHYRALEDLGLVFEALGVKKDALNAYRKALEVNPFLEDANEAVRFLSREVGSRNL